MRHGVEQGDSPLRYFCPSDSRAGVKHLVELDAHGGIGACNCENFQYRLEPEIKKGNAQSNPQAYRCKHIEYARDYLLAKVIEALVAQRRKTGVADDPHDSTERKT